MLNTRSTAVVMLTAGLACAVTTLERAAASENPAAGLDLAPSRRISESPPAPLAPPALPAGAEAVPSMTLSVATTWRGSDGQPRRSQQTVLRTADRILVVPEGARSEWLFERNVVDPRRMVGYLIDHTREQVLIHDDSDLRQGLRLRGWADVLMMRFDPRILAGLRATGEQRAAGGAVFERYVAAEGGSPEVAEVWWSEALLLPLQVTVPSAGGPTTTSAVESFEPSVNAALLTDPRRRLPQYEVMDVVDTADRQSHHH